MAVDVERCRVLLEVVRRGTLRAAAEELGYTPSGVSRALTTLEAELGLALLVRGRHGATPTAACRDLLPYLRRLVAAADACDERAQALLGAEAGSVRLGTAYAELYPTLTGAVARFGAAHPGVRASLSEGTSSDLVAQVEAGELDLALVSERPGPHAWVPLVTDELVALVPAGHELARAAAYPLARLATDPFVEIMPGATSDNSLLLAWEGVRPNVRYAVSDDEAGYAMVDAGLGVTLTNALHVRGRRGSSVALPLDPAVRLTIGAASPVGDVASPAARAFAELALPLLRERLARG